MQDYREVNEPFDHIVSIGMFEHVCYKNYRKYMEVVHKCLRDKGLFLLQTIGNNYSTITIDPWIGKYIFPNSMIPSMKQISESAEKLLFSKTGIIFIRSGTPTLMSWFDNFDRNWHELKGLYDDYFCRMWKYYLLSSAGTFRARDMQVWQIVSLRTESQEAILRFDERLIVSNKRHSAISQRNDAYSKLGRLF